MSCPSLRCCVVLRCELSFEHRAVPGIIRVVFYFFFFFFFYMCLIFHGPLLFPHANYPRTADQNVTPVTKTHNTAEHNRAICSAQAALGISNRCSHQIIGLFFLPLLHVFSCIFSCLPRAYRAASAARGAELLYAVIFKSGTFWPESMTPVALCICCCPILRAGL